SVFCGSADPFLCCLAPDRVTVAGIHQNQRTIKMSISALLIRLTRERENRFLERKTMQNDKICAIVVKNIALAFMLGAAGHAIAQDAKVPYPRMAPVEQYLMGDRRAEIALAQSAAPESISRDAEVLVLGRHGYESAIQGKNGFVCIV